MTNNITCKHCNTLFSAKSVHHKYCADECKKAAKAQRAREEYNSKRATGWKRQKTQYTMNCAWCNKEHIAKNQTTAYCSITCGNLARICKEEREQREAERIWNLRKRIARELNTLFLGIGQKAEEEALKVSPTYRLTSDISIAYVNNDFELMLHAVQSKSRVNETGCWEWQGETRSNYPVHTYKGKRLKMHRVMVEMKYGYPLGTQHSHHMCANSICVNPEHLQPVTHRENAAEMLARRSYTQAIKELKKIVAKYEPDAEILQEIELLRL